ncbi:MAG TPA: ATP-binding protein [Spirochaetota bacterium]|nr:ATP-binding protein [Spirochaetota bacterium]
MAEKTSIEEFERWLSRHESERLEFKRAENSYSKDKDLPDYCAAIANEGGGKLILGVTNDRAIVGTKAFTDSHNRLSNDLLEKLGIRVDVEELNHPAGRILIFHIPSHPLGEPVRSTGKYAYPMRAGESIVEMDPGTLRKILTEGEPDFSAKIVPGFSISDIDETAIDNFRKRWAQKQNRAEYSGYDIGKTLLAIGLINDNGLTYAALVLFGKKESIDRLLPGSEIIFEWRHDADKTTHDFRKNWREPFFKVYDDIWETINARNTRFPYQDGLFQLEVFAYSEKPVREALLNAVAHRDYTINSQSIFMHVSPDSFSIESPGGFPRGITVENILTKSVWRNRLIAEVFEKAGLVERSGQGMDDIFRKTISEGKGVPDFSGTDAYGVKLNIPAKIKDMNFILFLEKVSGEEQVSLTFEEIYELERIRRNQKVSTPEFKERFLSLNLIEKVGKTRDAKYILSHNYYKHEGKTGKYTRLTGVTRDMQKEFILRHLKKNQKGTLVEFQDIFSGQGVKPMDISNMLRELRREGLIEHQGAKKTGFWILSDKGK